MILLEKRYKRCGIGRKLIINSCIWAIVANTAAEMQKDNRFLRRKEICDTEFLEIATRIYNELLGFAARKYEILDIGE